MTRLTIISLFFILFAAGCSHYEPPPVPGITTSTKKSHTSKSRVDVSGVKDDVTSKKIIVKRIPFPVDEYNEINASGNSEVKGKIYITYEGRTIAGKQTRLYLNPVTSYSNQWYREAYLGGHKMAKSDPRLFNYLKFTASDSNGAFSFYGVSKGSYYVVGTVKCDDCGGKIIRIARKIRASGSNTVIVELSKGL